MEFYLPAEEHVEVPARKPAGLRPAAAGCGPQTDALHRPVHAAPAARVQHQGAFKVELHPTNETSIPGTPADADLCSQVTDAYSEFDAGRVIRVLQAFISRELSSFYFSIIKDR